MFIKACNIWQKTRIKSLRTDLYQPRKPVDYSQMESLSVDIKLIPKGFDYFLLVATCEITSFALAIPITL